MPEFRIMALATFVKISSVNNLSDARYCAGMEVDQLGFIIEEGQEGAISAEDFKEITDWLSGVEFIGELSTIATTLAQYKIDGIQIQSADQVEAALATGLNVVYTTDTTADANQVLTNFPKLSYVLLENDSIEELKQLDNPEQVVITNGFNADNVKSIVEEHNLKGIAMKGGDEIRPGYKNFDELADILEALDTDEYV